MKNIETTATATATETATVETPKKAPTQFTVNVTSGDKEFIADIVTEFGLKNTMEAVQILREVAENQRFHKVEATEEIDGEIVPVMDEDGQPVFETLDRWEAVADSIAANRGATKAQAQLAKLLEKQKELQATLKALGWSKK